MSGSGKLNQREIGREGGEGGGGEGDSAPSREVGMHPAGTSVRRMQR